MGEKAGRNDPPQRITPPSPQPATDAVQRRPGATPVALPHVDTVRRLVPRGGTRLRDEVLAVVLTCGDGTPLEALTRWHCVAALPFAGLYRNVDFALSNCKNSGIGRIGVVTQYKAHSLMQQVRSGWAQLWPESGESIELWPAERCRNEDCYRGTADAAYQNIHIVREHAPTQVLVVTGDHLCRMNYAHLIHEHRRRDADVTVGYVKLPVTEAAHSDVLRVDPDGWIRTFMDNPPAAANAHDAAERALVSLGIYVFDTNTLIDLLRRDAIDSRSWHDIGHDILPSALASGLRVLGHAFRDAATGDAGYCGNVGSVDGYWRANMEQLAERPHLDLHDTAWPIWTHRIQMPAARFKEGGMARESIVGAGCVLAGDVRHSVLSVDCEVGANTLIEDSVVLPKVRVGRGCRIKRAIIDAECVIADGTVIDAGSPLTPPSYVSPTGIVLVASAAATQPGALPRRRESTSSRAG